MHHNHIDCVTDGVVQLASNTGSFVGDGAFGIAELTLPGFLTDLEAGEAQPIYNTTGFPALDNTPVPQSSGFLARRLPSP